MRSNAEFVSDRPAQQVLELVKEKLVSTRPLLLFLSGCGAESTGLLAQAVRLRLSRPVFFSMEVRSVVGRCPIQPRRCGGCVATPIYVARRWSFRMPICSVPRGEH